MANLSKEQITLLEGILRTAFDKEMIDYKALEIIELAESLELDNVTEMKRDYKLSDHNLY